MSLLLLNAFSSAVIASSLGQTLTYQIDYNKNTPDQVLVSVDTLGIQSFTVLPARTLHSEHQPNLTCRDKKGGQRNIDYKEEVSCTQVSWTLSLSAVDPLGFDIASQVDTFSKPHSWALISEFNSIPRFATIQGEVYPAKVCMDERCDSLPSLEHPPLFVLWGLKPITLNIGDRLVTLTSDVPQVYDTLDKWQPALEVQLRYLAGLFPDYNTKNWKIAFFGREKVSGNISGAAGSNTILVNALLDRGQFHQESIPMLLKVTAHESMHIIHPSAPLWASESLAEYYAIKSLTKTAYSTINIDQQWSGFSQVFPFANVGLLEAHHHVSDQKQQQYYPLFYVKGPAFWLSLDQALMTESSSLDTLVADLDYESTGELTSSSVDQIVEIIGVDKWHSIAKKYL